MNNNTANAILTKNLDVILGLAAWSLGGAALLLRPWLETGLGQAAFYLAIPTLWTQLALLVYRHRARSLKQLFWVWFSAPLSLGYLVHGIVRLVIFLPYKQ